MNHRLTHFQKVFDFELGHLIKSPCRQCVTRHLFPGCMEACAILDRIQTHLAQGVCCTRTFSALDPFQIQLEKGADHRK